MDQGILHAAAADQVGKHASEATARVIGNSWLKTGRRGARLMMKNRRL
jgi:hypothetical protein